MMSHDVQFAAKPVTTRLVRPRHEEFRDQIGPAGSAHLSERWHWLSLLNASWSAMRDCAVDDAECCETRAAIDILQRALAQVGYAPR